MKLSRFLQRWSTTIYGIFAFVVIYAVVIYSIVVNEISWVAGNFWLLLCVGLVAVGLVIWVIDSRPSRQPRMKDVDI